MSIYVNNDTRVAQGKAQPDYSFLEPFFDKAFRIIRRNYAAPGSDTISIKTIKASYKDYRDRLKKHSMSTPIVMHLSDYSGDIRPIKKYNIMDTWLQTAMRLYAEYKTGYKPRSSVFSYRKKNGENTIRDYIKSWNTEKFLYVDIASFYKNTSKEILLSKLSEVLSDKELACLIRLSWDDEPGLPVGNSMSIFLSNYYLDDIDTLFDKGYARYGDDMFFDLTIHDKDILLQTLIKELNNLNLVLNKDKIRVINTGEFLKNV